MRNSTRVKYTAYVSRIAMLSGVAAASEHFTVEPSVAQKLEKTTQDSSEFLSRINFITVPAQEGEKVGVGITRSIASRTNTATKDRQPIDPSGLTSTRYRCEKTNFDTALKYERLDAWAHQPNFQTLIRDAISEQQGIDRMMIGWHGTHVAPETNLTAFPLLQDVNKGWVQNTRDDAPARIMSGGDHAADKIYVSATGTADYKNLDALVFDAIQLLDERHRGRTDLVVMVSWDLVHDKQFKIVNQAGDVATEQVARDVLLLDKKLGGKLAAVLPNFPEGTVVITTYKNLSIYNQNGTRRRAIIDNPKRDQVEDLQSVNEAYVVEDYGLIAIVENIILGPKV